MTFSEDTFRAILVSQLTTGEVSECLDQTFSGLLQQNLKLSQARSKWPGILSDQELTMQALLESKVEEVSSEQEWWAMGSSWLNHNLHHMIKHMYFRSLEMTD